MKHNTRVLGLIPARFASSRFPGKPLSTISGKTLIQRTYESAKQCPGLHQLFVATDDTRIADHVKSFGGNVVLTDSSCTTGTERIAQAVKQTSALDSFDLVINIQGDEPLIEPSVIEAVIGKLQRDNAVMSTAAALLASQEEALNPSVVKVVLDQSGRALYFSRSLIPGNKEGTWHHGVSYFKHVGIYGFTRQFLLQFAALPATPLQLAEDLEQLKALEHGYPIDVAVVESSSIGVDRPEDIAKIEKKIQQQQ